MATNNSSNQDYQNNADGAQLGGGVIKRVLKWLGSNITITGSGSNTVTLPASNTTLVGRDTTDTLTNKTIDASQNTITNLGTSTLLDSAVTSAKLSPSKAPDANGWTVYNLGTFKVYRKAFAIPSQSISTGGQLLTLTGNNLPVGVSTLGSLHCKYSIQFAAGSPFVVSNFDGTSTNTTINIGVARFNSAATMSGTCFVELCE